MRISLQELKKILLHQKGLLFIGIFLIIHFLAVVLFDKPVNVDIALNLEQYNYYLNQLQGSITEENETFLQNETEKILEAKIIMEREYENFYDGIISQEELSKRLTSFETLLQNEKGFEIIYEQYNYARENSEKRYIMNTNGWDALLTGEGLDFLLVLLLLLVITPIFCYEFECQMDIMILTVKKGARELYAKKICIALGLCLGLCLFTIIMKYIFFNIKYGLINGDFPLQSLSYFANSTKSLSIIQAFFCISVCKIFGYLIFCLFILFISVLIKKYALTLFICTATIILPYLGINSQSILYRMPGPLNFMIGTGFFRGSEQSTDIYTQELSQIFAEVQTPLLLILAIFTFTLGIIMWLVILRSSSNALDIKKHKRHSKLCVLIILCVFMLCMTGCDIQTSNNYDIYNSTSALPIESSNYKFYADCIDNDTNIIFEDKKTGEKQSLIKTPMKASIQIQNNIYKNGDFIYYAKYDIDKSGLKPQFETLFIIEVDIRTFREKIIFEKTIFGTSSKFLGIDFSQEVNSHYISFSKFFLSKTHIYTISEDKIVQINRITGIEKIINTSGRGNIAYDGRNIYYQDRKYNIVKWDSKRNEEPMVLDIVTEQFFLTSKEILFCNRQDKDKIYALNIENGKISKVSDISIWTLSADEEYIYYTNKDDSKDYCMNRNRKNIIPFEI